LERDGWPRCPVIYEIYPRSFRDSSGSGVGDLRGLLEKMDYIAALSVDAIWIAPFYPSPWDDGGYDVADHCGVDERLGDLENVKEIIASAHGAGLKVMTDQVLNHTSRDHPWFEKSANREDGFDDWYIWRDAKPDGSPPNNWLSYFGPTAWTWDHRRMQYYCHQFLECQPNLDLRNPEVQAALRDQMRFWRDLGIDGFRMDAISAYLHDRSMADNPPASLEVRARVAGPDFNPYSFQDHRYDLLPGDGAAYCERVREWAGPEAYLLGEINVGNGAIEVTADFTQHTRLDAAYTVDLVEGGLSAAKVAEVLARARKAMPKAEGRLAYWLSSHDQARHLTRDGDGSDHEAKFLALLCGCLPGPWLVYQGEELGLPQPELHRDEVSDPFDRLYWPDGPGREGARVPLPWEAEADNFGFTTGTPWLPMRWQKDRAVDRQEAASDSVLSFYRALLALRREHRWAEGALTRIRHEGDLLVIELRRDDGSRYRGLFNFGKTSCSADLEGQPLIASAPDQAPGHLPARSGALWRLDEDQADKEST